MKKTFVVVIFAIVLIAILYQNKNEPNTNKEEIKTIETDSIIPEETIPTIDILELSEEEYKSLCQEMYYDNFFKEEPQVNQLVKFNGFIAGTSKYTSSSTFGIIIEDIDDKYKFRKEYLGCCILHEETKDDAVPSYFGEHVYLMFPEDSSLYIENYKAGEYYIIYGNIVQTWSGIFVIPEYFESAN